MWFKLPIYRVYFYVIVKMWFKLPNYGTNPRTCEVLRAHLCRGCRERPARRIACRVSQNASLRREWERLRNFNSHLLRRGQSGDEQTYSRKLQKARWWPSTRTGSRHAGWPLAAMAIFVCLACLGRLEAQEQSASSLFQVRAMALRTAVLASSEPALEMLSLMPGAGLTDHKRTTGEASTRLVELLWKPFFENVVIETREVDSGESAALYYNPLLDVALYTRWRHVSPSDFLMTGFKAIAGEALTDPPSDAPLEPSWMRANDPVEAFARIAGERLHAVSAFVRDHRSSGAGEIDTYQRDSEDFWAAAPRLLWNVSQRAQWAEEQWLLPTLAQIQTALAAHDKNVLRSLAPHTDAVTEALLTELPHDFADRLALDMVIQDDGGNRILIGSMPEDGEIYIWALCLLEGDTCRLVRFALIGVETH